MPLVSVVIPSYNHAAYIVDAVNSVLTQSIGDLELIVVDDGSKDNSVEILNEFSDPRFRLLTQENLGAHAAINRGLAEASGKFLAILNSDDVYHPKRIEKLVELFESDSSLGLVASYIEVIDQHGKKLGIKEGYHNLEPWPLMFPERSFRAGDDLRAGLLTENFLATTSNYLFPKAVFDHVGPFRPLRFAHDWDFALRVAKITQLGLYPGALISYRVHPTNTIRENQAEMVYEICWILAVHLPQHIADETWFKALPLTRRIDQLIYSIHTQGCDRVLIVLLLQKISENLDKAMSLLEPDNMERKKFIAYISSQLSDPVELKKGNSKYLGLLDLRKIYRKLTSFQR